MQMINHICTYLSCYDEVDITEHARSVCYEVGHGLHDIPRILPPGQPCKDPKLHGHGNESYP